MNKYKNAYLTAFNRISKAIENLEDNLKGIRNEDAKFLIETAVSELKQLQVDVEELIIS